MDLRAVIFVPALVGCIVFGFIFSLFAANHYFTVLQSTGAGAKQVTWVREPVLDNAWMMAYLAWLIGLWLGPAYFLGRAFAGGSESVWLRLGIPLLVFWIAYPVSQLSSLSGPTIWLPLHPEVFGRLAQKPGVVLGFLALSGLALFGVGLGFHWTFFAPGLEWLAIGSVVFVLSALLYARLLGRLAFVLAFTRPFLTRRRKKRKSEEGESSESRTSNPSDGAAEAEPRLPQPSELPPLETPDEGALTGYDFQPDEVTEKPKKRVVAEEVDDPLPPRPPRSQKRTKAGGDRSREWTEEDEDRTAYGVDAAEVTPEEAAPVQVIQPTEAEMRLISRDDAPRKPKQAWTPELLAFLGQPETIVALVMLAVMCSAVGGMVRIARAFNPASEGP